MCGVCSKRQVNEPGKDREGNGGGGGDQRFPCIQALEAVRLYLERFGVLVFFLRFAAPMLKRAFCRHDCGRPVGKMDKEVASQNC